MGMIVVFTMKTVLTMNLGLKSFPGPPKWGRLLAEGSYGKFSTVKLTSNEMVRWIIHFSSTVSWLERLLFPGCCQIVPYERHWRTTGLLGSLILLTTWNCQLIYEDAESSTWASWGPELACRARSGRHINRRRILPLLGVMVDMGPEIKWPGLVSVWREEGSVEHYIFRSNPDMSQRLRLVWEFGIVLFRSTHFADAGIFMPFNIVGYRSRAGSGIL